MDMSESVKEEKFSFTGLSTGGVNTHVSSSRPQRRSTAVKITSTVKNIHWVRFITERNIVFCFDFSGAGAYIDEPNLTAHMAASSSPLEKFYQWESTSPEVIFLRQPYQRQWKTWTYRQAGEEIRKIARLLEGLPPRSKVALLSKNCAQWIMADLAIMMAGHVSVPIYPTLSADAIRPILEHSESVAIFIGKLDNYKTQQAGIPASLMRISMETYGHHEGQSWEQTVATGKPIERPVTPQADDLMTIVYTSGTTGKPKGVMHTVGNFDTVLNVVKVIIPGLYDHCKLFSYLPLSHVAERMGIELLGLYKGASISFAETIDTFAEDLKNTQPAIFFAVPRIWTKIQEKILLKLPQRKLNVMLRLPLINNILRKKLQHELGLSEAIFICSAAAPLSVSVINWFQTLGITIYQLYGMTEDCVLSHFNLIGQNKVGTVGRRLPGVESKISTEGEIRVRSKVLMKGYYKEPQLTADMFDEEGFLKTGDMGEFDADGYLKITGRVKDQFKTDKGKYISPAPIELMLTKNTDIEQVCVVGMGVPQPMALVVLSATGKAKNRDEITASLSHTISEINQHVEAYEKLETAVIMKTDWSVDNGLLTPTMKVKRNEVEKIHLPHYPRWYHQEGLVVWE
jgi:long-chain acyl-CoA synthetase